MAKRIKKKKPVDKVRKFIPIHQLKDTYPIIWSGEFEDLISNKRMLDDFLAACSIPFYSDDREWGNHDEVFERFHLEKSKYYQP